MPETRYDARSALRRPAAFVGSALADLRSGLGLAGWLLRSNLRVRYRRAWLGYFWLLLPAAGAALVSALVRSSHAVSTIPTGLPYPVFVLTGMMLWQVFVEALNAPMSQLGAARPMITRTRVPHEALLIAGLLEVLVNCAARLVVLGLVLALFRVTVAPTILLMPLGVVALALLGTAIGLLVTPLGLLYDDIGRGLGLGVMFWFFLTPILIRFRGAALGRSTR